MNNYEYELMEDYAETLEQQKRPNATFVDFLPYAVIPLVVFSAIILMAVLT